jgi:tRNA (cytidine32/uridine32-2'-O)-methyltransferase
MSQPLEPSNTSPVAFILVRPQFLGNIGSVARLMKNFGFFDLRFVEPPRNYKDAEARKMAVAAFDILKGSKTFASLSDAIADLHYVIGTSSGQQRKEQIYDLDLALRDMPANSQTRIGVVLGNEVDGLTREELSQCHVIARVPTCPEFSSLNLAQAAGIIAYELSRHLHTVAPVTPGEMKNNRLPPSVAEVDELFDQVAILLEKVEFARSYNKPLVLTELRQFFYRAMPSKREGDLLRGILHKLTQSIPEN